MTKPSLRSVLVSFGCWCSGAAPQFLKNNTRSANNPGLCRGPLYFGQPKEFVDEFHLKVSLVLV